MSVIAVTPQELNTRLLSFKDSKRVSAFPQYQMIYDILFEHGFRVRELFNITRFELQSDDSVICITSKGSNPRVIQLSEFPDLFQLSIIDQENYLTDYSYSSLERFFQKNIEGEKYTTGNKNLGTHLFRHNRIKQDVLNGMSDPALQVKFGFKNDSTLQGYKNSLIYLHKYN